MESSFYYTELSLFEAQLFASNHQSTIN